MSPWERAGVRVISRTSGSRYSEITLTLTLSHEYNTSTWEGGPELSGQPASITMVAHMSLRSWLQLALTDGIGPILARRLIENCGGVEAACAANTRLLQQVEGIGSHKAGSILGALRAAA